MLGWMRKNLLRRETRRWVDEGLVEPFQAERILNRYGTSLNDTGPSALGLLTGLAGLFAGLALLLLGSANWEQLARLAFRNLVGEVCFGRKIGDARIRLVDKVKGRDVSYRV